MYKYRSGLYLISDKIVERITPDMCEDKNDSRIGLWGVWDDSGNGDRWLFHFNTLKEARKAIESEVKS
jgi:hypothetical protein